MNNIYSEALHALNACNLGGLVHGWARVITALQKSDDAQGTEWLNTHPVNVLFVEQFHQLTGFSQRFAEALRECEARKDDPDAPVVRSRITSQEDPIFPLAVWRHQIVHDETRLGYAEWIEHQQVSFAARQFTLALTLTHEEPRT